MKILIIDDSKTVRSLIKIPLNELGYDDIQEAENGRQGLDILEKDASFDLILLDRVMPEMDGMEFLKKLRENDSYKTIAVTMVTGLPDEQEKMSALMEYGVDYYLEKPVTASSLVRMFSQLSKPLD